MIEVPVFDKQGKEVEKVGLDEAVLGGTVNRKLLRLAIHMYECNLRQGNAKTKERGEVAGSQKKPWKQKHTGRARAGDRRSPLWRGGGTIFGPRPRDYSYAMPKKMRRQATQSALLSKFVDGEVRVVADLDMAAPKTKEIAGILDRLGVRESCIIAVPAPGRTLILSARNIPALDVRPLKDLNAYELLLRKRLVLTKEALQAVIAGRWQGADVKPQSAGGQA